MNWSDEHLNFKRYPIERMVIWKKYDFQLKFYEKGEQNIQF